MSNLPNPQETATDLPPITGPPPIPAGVTHWHGAATGMWWAIVPGRQGPKLVEAVTADALAAAVDWHLRRAAW